MGIFDFIGSAVKPVSDVISTINTNDLEREKLKDAVGILERDLKRKAEEYDAELLKAQSSVIISEVNSESKAARSWRPHLMYLFMIIIFNNYIVYPYLKAFTNYGMLMEIPPQMWTLLQIGVGGYVAGRSLEKALPGIMNNRK